MISFVFALLAILCFQPAPLLARSGPASKDHPPELWPGYGFKGGQITGKATKPPVLESCSAPETAQVSPSTNPNRVRIDVKMACRGMLILSDTYFPGWHASIDREPAEIHEAYGALRGIVVDKGEHHIEFLYRPVSAIAGLALTALGILFVIWTRWHSRKDAVE